MGDTPSNDDLLAALDMLIEKVQGEQLNPIAKKVLYDKLWDLYEHGATVPPDLKGGDALAAVHKRVANNNETGGQVKPPARCLSPAEVREMAIRAGEHIYDPPPIGQLAGYVPVLARSHDRLTDAITALSPGQWRFIVRELPQGPIMQQHYFPALRRLAAICEQLQEGEGERAGSI